VLANVNQSKSFSSQARLSLLHHDHPQARSLIGCCSLRTGTCWAGRGDGSVDGDGSGSTSSSVTAARRQILAGPLRGPRLPPSRQFGRARPGSFELLQLSPTSHTPHSHRNACFRRMPHVSRQVRVRPAVSTRGRPRDPAIRHPAEGRGSDYPRDPDNRRAGPRRPRDQIRPECSRLKETQIPVLGSERLSRPTRFGHLQKSGDRPGPSQDVHSVWNVTLSAFLEGPLLEPRGQTRLEEIVVFPVPDRRTSWRPVVRRIRAPTAK
jgi:hypothetical protein